MTSGKRLTERQVDSILRLIRYRTGSERTHTKTSIGKLLDLDPRTVEEIIWLAAEREGERTQWHAGPVSDY